MNRLTAGQHRIPYSPRVPRAGGDEPHRASQRLPEQRVFPARAGMNRILARYAMPDECVPRAGGDEPIVSSSSTPCELCSPRGRG